MSGGEPSSIKRDEMCREGAGSERMLAERISWFLYFRFSHCEEVTAVHQALYRKWRPQAFADVVGQEHITITLRRQVEQGRPSHAYLFTGTRGTGKTTCAKILAKAVNCLHPVNGDPCNRCAVCRGIDDGSLLDVAELDAASNNGVDHVRTLREEAVYSPAAVKYRVYIVDEVHMLSTAAFNALLKILEEPPAHLIFILATTELHKVPATILSRCQRFSFKRILPQDIANRLSYVAEQEGIPLSDDAAALLARLSDGALRDALSLLDQCAAGGETVDTQRVLETLGLTGTLQTAELMERLLRRNAPEALQQLDELYRGGKDVGSLLGELSTLCRDLLIHLTVPKGGALLLSGSYDTATLDRLSREASATRLLYMTSLLQAAAAALPTSLNRRTDGELCLIKLCDESLSGDVTALAARLERLEAGGLPTAPIAAEAAATSRPDKPAAEALPPAEDPPPWDESPSKPVEKPAEDSAGQVPPRRRQTDEPPEVSEPPKASPEPSMASAPSKGSDIWQELLPLFQNQLSPRYRWAIESAYGYLEGDVLVVGSEDDFILESLTDSREVQEVLERVTGERLGRKVSLRVRRGAIPTVQTASADKLDTLLRAGSQYENFIVK